MIAWWLLPAAFAASLVLTGLLRRYALGRSLLDIPNQRSSHRNPTPRGGGVAIVLVLLACLPLLWREQVISGALLMAIGGAGVGVAVVGFIDDHRHIAVRWRLLAHFAAAAWALYWLGGMPPVTIGDIVMPAGTAVNLLAALGIVWLLNLYNFMDGIDALAALEAITLCLGGVLLYVTGGHAAAEWLLPAALLAAAAGFLCWNFPPARIFMGDAGSGFLGVTFAIFTIRSAQLDSRMFWAWQILLGAFIADATITLLRRLLRRRRLSEAHNTHGYQFAARRLGSHRQVSLAIGAINLCWLLPLAVAVNLGYLDALPGLGIAYAPLVWLAFHFRAGAAERK